ncbi:MAG: choice-of-anchor V domain-containing protein, partial [Myxococcota bacterium]
MLGSKTTAVLKLAYVLERTRHADLPSEFIEEGCPMKRMLSTACLALASLVILAQAAHAFPTGISTGFLGASGCNGCHSGGSTPTVSLTGPTTVSAGTTNEYLFVIDS